MQCSLFSWKTGHQTRNLISQENDVSTLIGKEPLPMETKDTEISSEKQVSMGII